MEANFIVTTKKQQKGFKGAVSKDRMTRLLRFKDIEAVNMKMEVVGPYFMENSSRWKVNLDIISMVIAWGLEIGDDIETVKWAATSLFDDDFIEGLDSILEWVVPGVGFDYSEGFEEAKDTDVFGIVSFVRWIGKVDKKAYVLERAWAWDKLKGIILSHEREDNELTWAWPKVIPKGRRSGIRKRRAVDASFTDDNGFVFV